MTDVLPEPPEYFVDRLRALHVQVIAHLHVQRPQPVHEVFRGLGKHVRHPRTTGLLSMPIPGTPIETTSPGWSVKSSGGTIPVPVRRKTPSGKRLSRPRYSTNSSKRR